MRKAFENWYYGKFRSDLKEDGLNIFRMINSEYYEKGVQLAWLAWEASRNDNH